jgi:hypothetical protein
MTHERELRGEHAALERRVLWADDEGFPGEEIRFRHRTCTVPPSVSRVHEEMPWDRGDEDSRVPASNMPSGEPVRR